MQGEAPVVLLRLAIPNFSKAQSRSREHGRTTHPHRLSSRFLHVCAPALRCSTRRVARRNAHLRKLTLRLCTDLHSYVRNLPVCIVPTLDLGHM